MREDLIPKQVETVENGHIYSSIKEEEVFIYWAHSTFSLGKLIG